MSSGESLPGVRRSGCRRSKTMPDDDTPQQYHVHKAAFDAAVAQQLAEQKATTSPVLTEEQHAKILSAMVAWTDAERAIDDPRAIADAKKAAVADHGHNLYKWASKYAVLEIGGVSHLVFTYAADTPLDEVQQPSHTGRVFDDLMRAHVTKGAHRKARGLQAAVTAAHGKSIPRWMCKLFTDSCPHCIKSARRARPTRADGRGAIVCTCLSLICPPSSCLHPFRHYAQGRISWPHAHLDARHGLARADRPH